MFIIFCTHIIHVKTKSTPKQFQTLFLSAWKSVFFFLRDLFFTDNTFFSWKTHFCCEKIIFSADFFGAFLVSHSTSVFLYVRFLFPMLYYMPFFVFIVFYVFLVYFFCDFFLYFLSLFSLFTVSLWIFLNIYLIDPIFILMKI